MSLRLTCRLSLILLLALGMFAGVLRPAVAEDAVKEEAAKAETAKEDVAKDDVAKDDAAKDEKEADPYAIPADAKTADLVEFIAKTMNSRPAGKTREEMIANYVKAQHAVSDAASRILADKEAKEDAMMAIHVKVRAMQALEQLADEDLSAEKKKLIDLYQDDKRPGVSEMIAFLKVWTELDEHFQEDSDPKKSVAALVKAIEADNGKNAQLAELFNQYAETLEYKDAYLEAVEVYKKLQEVWSKSDNRRLKMRAKSFDGMIRRLGLFGKKIDLEGKFLDGSDVDWEAYRGKYVLVDFWATWCGPCIQELPNVLENYEKYHDKGFDVLGISLDGSREPGAEAIAADKKSVAAFMEDRKLPWKTMYSDDATATGWKHPMATKFGISGIPFAMLVDPEGKVISFNARGPALGELLAKNLGEEKPGGEEKAADEEKPADEVKPASVEEEAKG